MAEIDLGADVDISTVEKAIERLARWGRDLRPILKEMRRPLLRDQKEHRQAQSGPSGKWAPLSPFTIQKQQARGRRRGRTKNNRMGRVLGRLPTAFKLFFTFDTLKLESLADWSGAHQDGATNAGRAPKIPQRQFFWISDNFIREAEVIVTKALEERWL